MSLRMQRKRFMMVGGAIGAIFVFIATGMLGDIIKVAIGGLVGIVLGSVAWAFVARSRREQVAVDLRSLRKAELEDEARRFGIEHPTSMTKAQLAEAIAARVERTDPTGELLIETVGAVGARVQETVESTRERLADRNGNGNGSR
jgi:hypothetical protein